MPSNAPVDDGLALLGAPLREPAALAAQFRAADPFPHLVIDGFLRDDASRALLDEFPGFEAGNVVDENGRPGDKSVTERVARLGPTFATLDRLSAAARTRTALGRISTSTSTSTGTRAAGTAG